MWKSRSWNERGSRSTSEARAGLPLCPPDQLRRMKETVLVYADLFPAKLRSRPWDEVPLKARHQPARASPEVMKAA